MRVSGYRKRAGAWNGTGNRAGNHAAPDYLTYGYDEFGNDLYRELEESGIPSPYDRQGEEQPFGYTGYRYDDISGTYFAQAREYQPENGRFTAEDVHWNAQNNIYGDGWESNIPDLSAIRQSNNLYVYGMNNAVRYIDSIGCKAGDTFTSMDDAAIDFAETTNGKSIEEDVEYGSYIYSWKETKKFLRIIPITKTYYSYTEPFTENMEGHVHLEDKNPPIPNGTKWVASAHTHGAWEALNNQEYKKLEYLNDTFSDKDIEYAKAAKVIFYLATPEGSLKAYDWRDEQLMGHSTIVEEWKLPHDKNHPELPAKHSLNCEDCFEKNE